MDDELCRKMQDLKIRYEKLKTKEGVINDMKKISSFFSNSCNNEVFDFAFTNFITLNQSKVSHNCLIECIRKMQRMAAHKCNNTERDNESDEFY